MFTYLWIFVGSMLLTSDYYLPQNPPVTTGTTVTFTIEYAGTDTPFIAWDFGDGSGLGSYKKSLTASHTFYAPGAYRVYARIMGEEIPVSVVQTITSPLSHPTPTHSSTITIDTASGRVWVVNADNNSVTCIDTETYEKIAEVQVGKHPRTIDIDRSGNAWVTNEDDATVSIVNALGNVVKNVSLPYASRPYGVCFDPQGNYAYVTLQATGKLLKVDASTHEIISEAEVGRSPRGIAVSSDGSMVYVTQFISSEKEGLVRKINAVSMMLEKEISLPFDTTPDFEDKGRGVPNYISSITISPDGKTTWVPCKKDNVARGLLRDGQELTFDNTVRTIASKIDLETGEEDLSSRIDFNDSDLACAVEFSPYGNIAFVAVQGNNRVHVVDAYNNARIGSIVNTGLAPQGMVLNADGSKLFVHNFMSRTVKVYNTESIVLSNNFDHPELATISTVSEELLSQEVLEGKQLFYNAEDTRMTFAGYISCASCHLDGGSDERVWDFTDRGEGLRNTHSLHGRRGTGMGNVHWTANFDEIQDFENDIRNAFKGSGFLPDSIFNSGTVNDPLGSKKAGLSRELDALAAYVNSLDKVHPSPFREADGSLTADGQQGKILFSELGCGNCHKGTDFTDRAEGLLHDVGTLLPSSGKRRNETLTGIATPTLKGIWETAPYLHDGSAASLKDVLITRNAEGKHGATELLTEMQLDQLISYLLQIDESEYGGIPTATVKPESGINLIQISPNPAREKIEIKIDNINQESGRVEIRTVSHQLVYLTFVDHHQERVMVDISNLRDGIYFVSFFSGERRSIQKLIIHP